jgi:hypothetical protein
VNEFNPNAKIESVAVETSPVVAPKTSIGIAVADAPAVPKHSTISVEGYGYESLPLPANDAHNMETALQHRDGIDSFCGWVEWRMTNTAHWNSTHELEYQARRQKEIEFWKKFMTPDERFSEVCLKRMLKSIWTFPIKCGRSWSFTTISTAVSELELKEFLQEN